MTESLTAALAWVGGVTSALCFFGWTFRAFVAARVARFSDEKPEPPARWPRLSVIVPARDEAETIEPALRSLLRQDYPELQIVVVDDRSSDETGGIIDQLAAEDDRITALHLASLPEGWLGKVHAQQRGYELSEGEWVLFTDADVRFDEGALRRGVAMALAHELDHLTLLPELDATGPMQGGLMALTVDMIVERTFGRRGVVQEGGAAFGFGAFNLVRRAPFDETEGLEWIKLDVLDDLALGALMKRSGARCGFAVADEGVRVLWYPTFRAALGALDKNFVGGVAGYRLSLLALMGLFFFVTAFAPPLALVTVGSSATFAAALLAVVVAAFVARGRYGRPLSSGLLEPIAMGVLGAYMVLLSLRYARRRELSWRGTPYAFEALKAGRRVTFP
jgi:glycosyltransferase involved in cell wall biosynthesis